MKRLIVVLLVVLAMMGTLWAGGSQEKSGYVFAADATWPPLEFIDESGRLTGFEVELVQAMGNAVGEIFTVKNIPWDTIFAGLANGAYDAVASGVTVTEERKATMDFSNPILNVGQVVQCHGNTDHVKLVVFKSQFFSGHFLKMNIRIYSFCLLQRFFQRINTRYFCFRKNNFQHFYKIAGSGPHIQNSVYLFSFKKVG